MLSNLRSPKQKQGKIQVGRGYGSGRGGHTSGRGQKGQKSRSGYRSPRPGFEGGAMPLSRRLPKLKGFSRNFLTSKRNDVIITFDDLNIFDNGSEVSVATLEKKGLITKGAKKDNIKILSNGKLEKKVVVKGIALSKTARETIEKIGGKVE